MKKKVKIMIIILCILFLITFVALFIVKYNKDKLISQLENIKNHYSKTVITNDISSIYKKEKDNYVDIGKVEKNVLLNLKEDKITNDTKYFTILNMDEEYFIEYQDVIPSKDKYIEKDSRYKNYIVFNYNVITDKKTSFYDKNGNLIYSLNKSYSLPLIIKDNEMYGVEFKDEILYIKKEESKLEENNNTDIHNASGVAVLNYHAFYDENDPEDACPTVICHSKKQFREQLDYLKENNILTVKTEELENYIDGKIQLPKSVLITIDDGARESIAVDLLTEYKMYGTIFMVTSWYDEKQYYKTDYIELHAHTHNMHDGGKCPGGQGGGIKCLPEDVIQEDLKQNREELNGSTIFAYPFYEYNNYSIEMLKKAGFTMAFAGETTRGDNLVHVNSDKFRLNRYVIVNYTTIKDLNKYFSQIK